MLDVSHDVDLCKDVPVWGFVDIAPYLGCQISPKFPAKCIKNCNLCNIETTPSIATKSIHGDRYSSNTLQSSMMVQMFPKQIQVG